MQLHIVPQRLPSLAFPGTPSSPCGVETPDAETRVRVAAAPVCRVGWRGRVLLALALLSLLGQGERLVIDPLLRAPGSALAAYWEAIQLNDVDRLESCAAQPLSDVPFPGMLWSFPATRACWITDIRFVPIESGRLLASYDVHYRPVGHEEEHTLAVVTELVKLRGEWRIVNPLSEAGLLDGAPPQPPVDI
jgi:hypothetical protein